MFFSALRVDQKLDHAPRCISMSYHVFFCLASDETFSALWRRVWPRCLADLVGGKGAVAERSECCRERSRAGGGSVAEVCSGTSHQPPPTPANECNRPSNENGGAQDIINTGSNHRRRNRSPAWLLAQRSAQWSRSEAEDGTEDRRGDSGDKVG